MEAQGRGEGKAYTAALDKPNMAKCNQRLIFVRQGITQQVYLYGFASIIRCLDSRYNK
jgi:hypothetical protein